MTYASMSAASRETGYRRHHSIDYSLKKGFVLGTISNFVILLVLTCLLLVFYLSQVIKTSGYSYVIADYSQQQQQLEDQYRQLVIQSTNLQSTGRIEAATIEASLVQPEVVNLVQPTSDY